MTLMITRVLKPRLNEIGRKNQAIQSRIAKWRIQSIYGLKDVKVLHREEFFVRNYYESGAIGANVARNYAVMNNTPRLLIETVFIAAMLSFILVYMLEDGDITVLMPQLMAFAAAAIRVMPATNRINTYLSEIAYAQPCLDYLYENLTENMKQDVNGSVTGLTGEAEEEKTALALTDKIVLDHISYTYPNTDKLIFDHAELTIDIGSAVGIVGVSGAGKSTIVDVLLGLLEVRSGTIYADGVDVKTCYRSFLKNIGYIPQMIFMLDDTIRKNVAFGVHEEEIDEARVWEVLREAQLDEFVRSLPEGLDTGIGERGIRLSGGQRQRVAIARALSMEPALLVADEPIASLDVSMQAQIVNLFRHLQKEQGFSFLFIAHDLAMVEFLCDRVGVMYQGRLVETGSVKEIFHHPVHPYTQKLVASMPLPACCTGWDERRQNR